MKKFPGADGPAAVSETDDFVSCHDNDRDLGATAKALKSMQLDIEAINDDVTADNKPSAPKTGKANRRSTMIQSLVPPLVLPG